MQTRHIYGDKGPQLRVFNEYYKVTWRYNFKLTF